MGRRRFLRLGEAVSVAVLFCRGLFAGTGEAERRYFNVPEGKAVKTLKLAVKQAKVEIMLSAEIVKGVRTRKIRGTFTPIEAFNRMLSGTQLLVIRHEQSGVYTIKKIADSKAAQPDPKRSTDVATRSPVE